MEKEKETHTERERERNETKNNERERERERKMKKNTRKIKLIKWWKMVWHEHRTRLKHAEHICLFCSLFILSNSHNNKLSSRIKFNVHAVIKTEQTYN